MSDWTVITVTYNSEGWLRRYWGSQAERGQFRWIVIDNGSSDGTVELAADLADDVIVSPGNIGFSAANNLALKVTSTPYVAFVNPDVSIEGAGWHDSLARAADTFDALVAPQLRNRDGSFQANARGIPFLLDKLRHRLAPESEQTKRYARAGFPAPTYCAWVMGAALAGRTEHFTRLGGWDDGYFLYYEDHEIGLRAWRRGIPVVLYPAVEWVHDWQRETKSINLAAWRSEVRSMFRFYSAYRPLALGSPEGPGVSRALDELGLARMAACLWTPSESGQRG